MVLYRTQQLKTGELKEELLLNDGSLGSLAQKRIPGIPHAQVTSRRELNASGKKKLITFRHSH